MRRKIVCLILLAILCLGCIAGCSSESNSKRTCSVRSCKEEVYRKGFCEYHYYKNKKEAESSIEDFTSKGESESNTENFTSKKDNGTDDGINLWNKLVSEDKEELKIPKAAGLYDKIDVMIYSWDELVSNGFITIDGNMIVDAYVALVGQLVISDSIVEIGDEAFGCSSLTSITIPDSVTGIGCNAFYNCSNLTSITIPDSVTWIGDGAFCYCSSLTSVTIPDGVTWIADYAFNQCFSLVNITIPDSVTWIGDMAFFCCSSLTSVTIPDSVTWIGDMAFFCCSSLTSITIPDSVTSIGYNAFDGCNNLRSINVRRNSYADKRLNEIGYGSVIVYH